MLTSRGAFPGLRRQSLGDASSGGDFPLLGFYSAPFLQTRSLTSPRPPLISSWQEADVAEGHPCNIVTQLHQESGLEQWAGAPRVDAELLRIHGSGVGGAAPLRLQRAGLGCRVGMTAAWPSCGGEGCELGTALAKSTVSKQRTAGLQGLGDVLIPPRTQDCSGCCGEEGLVWGQAGPQGALVAGCCPRPAS